MKSILDFNGNLFTRTNMQYDFFTIIIVLKFNSKRKCVMKNHFRIKLIYQTFL